MNLKDYRKCQGGEGVTRSRGATAGFTLRNLWSVQTRTAKSSQLVDLPVDIKVISSYFDNQLSISVTFQEKKHLPGLTFQMMLFFVMYSVIVNGVFWGLKLFTWGCGIL